MGNGKLGTIQGAIKMATSSSGLLDAKQQGEIVSRRQIHFQNSGRRFSDQYSDMSITPKYNDQTRATVSLMIYDKQRRQRTAFTAYEKA